MPISNSAIVRAVPVPLPVGAANLRSTIAYENRPTGAGAVLRPPA